MTRNSAFGSCFDRRPALALAPRAPRLGGWQRGGEVARPHPAQNVWSATMLCFSVLIPNWNLIGSVDLPSSAAPPRRGNVRIADALLSAGIRSPHVPQQGRPRGRGGCTQRRDIALMRLPGLLMRLPGVPEEEEIVRRSGRRATVGMGTGSSRIVGFSCPGVLRFPSIKPKSGTP